MITIVNIDHPVYNSFDLEFQVRIHDLDENRRIFLDEKRSCLFSRLGIATSCTQ